MSLSEATLRKLSKDEVINMLLDYQNKFDTTLTRMNTDLSDLRQDPPDLKQNYIKLVSKLSVTRQVNNKPKDHTVYLERQYWSHSQDSKRKYLEISGSPDKTDQKYLEDTALNVFRKLDVEIVSSNIEDCLWLPKNRPKRAIIKFSNRKDTNKICHCKKNLKCLYLISLDISSSVFINNSFC